MNQVRVKEKSVSEEAMRKISNTSVFLRAYPYLLFSLPR